MISRDTTQRPRRRIARVIALSASVAIASTAIVAAGGGTAGAAGLPQAQSVGNFLDATVGGMTLDQIAKLKYATAVSPGSQSVQNPLDATVLNALELPLTGALKLPQLAGINLGAVNQVAVAKSDGMSYGGSGAVNNSGGISVGGQDGAPPADASIDLCASAITGGKCGTGAGDQLGQVKVGIGAVSGVASTPKGYGKDGATQYKIAGLDLQLGSPLLGNLLGTLTSTLGTGFSGVQGALTPITSLLSGLGLLPSTCVLVSGKLPTTISLDGGNNVKGIITIDAATGQINLSLDKLLKSLDLDLNHLPANTDLVKYIVDNLSKIISDGLGGLVNGLIDTVTNLVKDCTPKVFAAGFDALVPALTGAISTITGAVGNALKPVTDAIAPLLDVLKNVVDIGVNVQPNGPKGTYESPLDATPKQGTPVVKGQTIVRAIEVDLLSNVAGGVSLPGLNNFASGRLAESAVAPGGLLSLALGNGAAGPSTAPAGTPSTSPAPPSNVPSTDIPTGVPAGAAGEHGGSPVLPLIVLLLGLTVAGGGFLSHRLRGKYTP